MVARRFCVLALLCMVALVALAAMPEEHPEEVYGRFENYTPSKKFAFPCKHGSGARVGKFPDVGWAHPKRDPGGRAQTYSNHKGTDVPGPRGNPIYAAADGLVVYTYNNCRQDRCTSAIYKDAQCKGCGGGFGNQVITQSSDGTQLLYLHMIYGSVAVKAGDFVRCGTFLGRLGSSGYSTGHHLHFEVQSTRGKELSWVASHRWKGSGSPVLRQPWAGPQTKQKQSMWVQQNAYPNGPDSLPSTECDRRVMQCEIGRTGLMDFGHKQVKCNDETGIEDDVYQGGSMRYNFFGCKDASKDGRGPGGRWGGYYTHPDPHKAYYFVTDQSGKVALTFQKAAKGKKSSLDIYVLRDARCDASNCIATRRAKSTSDDDVVLEFEAVANHYYVVIVATNFPQSKGRPGSFRLTAKCQGSSPFMSISHPLLPELEDEVVVDEKNLPKAGPSTAQFAKTRHQQKQQQLQPQRQPARKQPEPAEEQQQKSTSFTSKIAGFFGFGD